MPIPLPTDLTVIFTSPDVPIGLRRSMPRKNLLAPSFRIDRFGGFGPGEFPTSLDYTKTVSVLIGDRVEVSLRGVLLYRGYVSARMKSNEDPRKLSFVTNGTSMLLRKQPGEKNYAFPIVGGGVDVANGFAQYAADTLLQATGDGGNKLVYSVVALPIGTTITTLTAKNQLSGDTLDNLTKEAGNLAVWGTEIDPEGYDRLFFRPISPLAPPTWVRTVPAQRVVNAQGQEESGDIVNILIIQGGVPRYPDLLHNGSFEIPTVTEDGSGSLVQNGSFEGGTYPNTPSWTMNGGASVNTTINNSPQRATAYVGSQFLDLDHTSENAVQTENIAPAAGDIFTLSMQAAKQVDLQTAYGHATLQLYSAINQGGTLLATITVNLTPAGQAWEYWAQSFAMPSGVHSFRLTINADNVTSLAGAQGGLIVDDVQFWDSTTVFQDGWIFQPQGGTAEVVAYNWVYEADKYEGQYCVYGSVISNDADGQDLQLRPPNGNRMKCYGGQTLRFSGFYKSPPDGNTFPKFFAEIDWFGSGGGYISRAGHGSAITPGGTTIAGWTYFELSASAPNDATDCDVTVTLRSNGSFLFDALALTDANAPSNNPASANAPYQPDGNTQYVIRADSPDLVPIYQVNFPAVTPPYASSISTYGTRADVFSDSNIITYNDALVVANNIFNAQASILQRPSVTFVDDSSNYLPGQSILVLGLDGVQMTGGPLSIARVSYKTAESGLLEVTLELEKESPAPEIAIKKIILDQLRRLGPNNSSSSYGGGGSGSPSGAVGGVATATDRQAFAVSGSGPYVFTRTNISKVVGVYGDGILQDASLYTVAAGSVSITFGGGVNTSVWNSIIVIFEYPAGP